MQKQMSLMGIKWDHSMGKPQLKAQIDSNFGIELSQVQYLYFTGHLLGKIRGHLQWAQTSPII